MERILITGAKGFIGSHLLRYVNNLGYEGIGWGRNTTEEIRNVHLEDVNEITESLMLDKPDMIVHCAGHADVKKSIENPQTDFNSNVICTYNLLQAVKNTRLHSKILFLSSAAVYGNPSKLPIKENADRNPMSPYALHKIMAEDICLFFRENYAIPIKIARIFSTYGNGLQKQIFWDMNTKLRTTGRLCLFGTGAETRDYIHIDDLVRALILILNSNTNEMVFNVANGEETTIKKAAEVFVKARGIDDSLIEFNGKNREGDPLFWRADISKLINLGYKPRISLEDGLCKYAAWVEDVEKNKVVGNPSVGSAL